MRTTTYLLALVLISVSLIACNKAIQPTAPLSTAAPTIPSRVIAVTPSLQAARSAVTTSHCTLTHADELSPTYKPDAPVRSVVGHGHILTGTVRSSVNCAPIPGAKLELWPEGPDGGHPDEYRSTVFTDTSGAYRFECNPTDHIHIRISAPGYRTIASNAYHTQGQPEGVFDIVLEPDGP